MQKETVVSEIPIVKAVASEGVVLTVLSYLKNGKIEKALASFAEEFRFKDHGIGLEFTNKKKLAEFFEKLRELYPDAVLQTDAIFANGDHLITEWTLQVTLTEPFWGGLKRSFKISLRGVSIVRIDNGKITEWADYYDGLTSRRTALASFFTEWMEL